MVKINLDKSVLAAEQEIDNYYLSHPFIKLNKVEALWYLLCVSEENMMMNAMSPSDDLLFRNNYADNIKYVLKYCMNWINRSCPVGGIIPSKSDPKLKELAKEFLNIGFEYQIFVMQYTLAMSGYIKLKKEKNTLTVNFPYNYDRRFEAYNILVIPELLDKKIDVTDTIEELQNAVFRNFKMKKGQFTYSIKPKDVINGINYMSIYTDYAYELPPDWRFTNYSLSEFKEVYDALTSLALFHSIAYNYSIGEEQPYGGFIGNIYRFKMVDMINRLLRYTKITKEAIDHILSDLTYGKYNFDNPDPALQPIIPITNDYFAIIPSILSSNSPERNLIVLLNRIPEERKIYSKISNEKENLMRKKIKKELKNLDYRYWSGTLTKTVELPDIDLVIIDDSEKFVVICELKWFIDPAETREMIQKSEEIVKGIKQVKKLREYFKNNKESIEKKFNINSDYDYTFLLISENFTGLSAIQVKDVPVINRLHLIKKIKDQQSLRDVSFWLKQRNYLPTEAVHFKIHIFNYKVGKWSISNEGYEPLIEDSLVNHT